MTYPLPAGASGRILPLALLLLASVFAPPAGAQDKGAAIQAREAALERYLQMRGSVDVLDECTGEAAARRDVIMNGNKITTQVFNFGSISAPGNTLTDIVWNGLGYGYEFGPFVAAEVRDDFREEGRERDSQSVPKRDADGRVLCEGTDGPVRCDALSEGSPRDTVYVMHIVSDGLSAASGGEVSPSGDAFWGWQPIPCAQPVGSFEGLQVVNPVSDKIPTNDAPDRDLDGKPDSWPDAWYNAELGEYVWPGALQQGASNADKEALYFMNDYGNEEFAYLPFPDNPELRGLGLEVETRLYQWSNPLSEDVIFLIYKITNKSERRLDDVVFGMWGDPHVGGPGDWGDDLASFDTNLDMVFTWDDDGRSDVAGRTPGYFGYKFLESPGIGDECTDGGTVTRSDNDGGPGQCSTGTFIPGDNIDNDGDGLVDESWQNGLDDNGNWNVDTDDVGVDGIPGTGDEGEGDGQPTAGDPFDITRPGEPNFEFTDIVESDQLGLTSFNSPAFGAVDIENDAAVWDMVRPRDPREWDEVPDDPGDYVFVYGSGRFSMEPGQTKRFSIALLLGENRSDLTLNARTVQEIYNAGYVFAKPPAKPTVRAVPGDQKVTLYWDDLAERSVDPLTRERDFEGYVIYRSTDHNFSDQQTITDINGTRFLFRPLESVDGVEAKFDLDNGLTGPAPVPYRGRGVAYDLGDDTGLFHTYVDSNNVLNGQRYFYSVVAYDRGDVETQITPTETNKTITYDPTTDTYIFDTNTVSVVPGPRVAGYVEPEVHSEGDARVFHERGAATGRVEVEIVDELAVRDDNPYRLAFDRVDGERVYSVVNERPVTVRFAAKPGFANALNHPNLLEETITLSGPGGATIDPAAYRLNAALGSVVLDPGGPVAEGDTVAATFKYAPVYRNSALDYDTARRNNLVFDGLRVLVGDDALGIDREATGWIQGDPAVRDSVAPALPGGPVPPVPQAADYEIRFYDDPVGEDVLGLPIPFEVVNLTRANTQIDVFVGEKAGPDNTRGVWDVAPTLAQTETILFVEEIDGRQIASYEVIFRSPDGSRPAAGDVYYVRTTKPFTDADAYTFRTEAARTDPERVRAELDEIYVVPNPYVATNRLERRNPISNSERGDRLLYFANLPQQCTIRIYTLDGVLVDTIEHDEAMDQGKAYWDLRTRDNMNISYGLYFFHVQAPEGEYTGKFAVIK